MNDELDSIKRKWTAEQRRQLAAGDIDGGFAGPDQSFPIAGPSDVGDAWGLAGQAANPDQVRRKIIAIAKRFGWQSGLPASALEWAEENGVSIKAGRRLSAKQLARLAEARQTIDDLVRWANYADDEPEPPAGFASIDVSGGKAADLTVKSLGNGRLGGYAVLWGSSAQRDLTGEYFTQETRELDAIFTAMKRLPLLYHHGADGKMETAVVGPVDVMQRDEAGLWYEAQIALAGEYRQALEGLVEQGLLGTSSGTLPAARRVERRSGRITRWPIAELSLTPTPAEPRMMETPVAEVKAAYITLGLDWTAANAAIQVDDMTDDEAPEATKATEPENGGDDADTAQADEIKIEMERLALLKLEV